MASNLAFLLALWALILVPQSVQSLILDDESHIPVPNDSGSFGSRDIEARDTSFQYRRLTAASIKSSIETRDISFEPKSQHSFHYVDGEYNKPTQLAAQVHLVPRLPTLALEDVETHLHDIICSESTIELVFTAQVFLTEKLAELATLSRFILITSHIGCNEDGERKAYLVSDGHIQKDIFKVVLSVEPLLWSSMFETMSVEFGSSRNTFDYEVRSHENLRKRQPIAASSTVSIPTYTYSFTSGSTPTATAALDMNLNHQLINKELASFSASNKLANGSYTATTSEAISVSCKNCTLTGTIDVVHGYFTANGGTANSSSSHGAANFFDHGYMKVQANNLAAYVELESTINLKQTLSYTGHLTGQPIPLDPFSIPGIANVGPYFDPQFYGKLVLEEEMTFTYGFDLTVPNGSNVILDFGDVANTTSSGFEHTTVTAIPFQASSPQISLNATMGFKPSLGVDIEIFEGLSEAGAVIFLDLPKINLDIVSVTHRNLDCDLPASNSGANKTLSYIFDSLLNLIPSVEIGVGAGFDVKIDVGDYDRTNSTEFIVTSWALPTKCLAYDDKAATFAPAVVPTIATSLTGNIGGDNGGGDDNGGEDGSLTSPFSASSPRRASAIAGTVIGVVLGLLLLGALSWFLRWHSQHSRAASAESTELLGMRAGMPHNHLVQPPETGMKTAAETHRYYRDYESKGGSIVEVRDQATDIEE